jgi:hypothetical protein
MCSTEATRSMVIMERIATSDRIGDLFARGSVDRLEHVDGLGDDEVGEVQL